MHAKRLWRQNNPIRDAFNNLRNSAKKRKKDFDLSLTEFTFLCNLTNYPEQTGNTKLSLTIDRIDNAIGYCLSNLSVVFRDTNSLKRNYVDYPRN